MKTRLIPALGMNEAAQLYEKLLYRTLETASKLLNVNVILTHDSATENSNYCQNKAREFGFELRNQTAGDLGKRMYFALKEALAHSSQVVVIGSDCPEYSTNYLQRAFNALDSHDVVIGPASDGGYVLLGAKSAEREIFQDIPWSSNKVYDATCRQLKLTRCSWVELETLNDIDEQADLVHVQHLLHKESILREMA